MQINLSHDQVTNVAAAVVATHGLATWHRCVYDGAALSVPDDIAGIVSAIDPDVVPAPTAADISAECDRRIAVAFAGKRASILSYAIALSGKALSGLAAGQTIAQALTAEEHANVSLIWALDAWEGDMIAKRESLIAAADPTYADNAHWPEAPAGLTAAWLKDF